LALALFLPLSEKGKKGFQLHVKIDEQYFGSRKLVARLSRVGEILYFCVHFFHSLHPPFAQPSSEKGRKVEIKMRQLKKGEEVSEN